MRFAAPLLLLLALPSAVSATCRRAGGELPPRDPLPGELRCRHGVWGPGRFGLLAYADVPVYQPRTPFPGTHTVGVPGMPGPAKGESFEAWEWRLLRTHFGAEETRVQNSTRLLDPFVAARLLRLERRLAEEGVPARRRETWRSPSRQAWLFQQGRSRPGPLATATLTSWHCATDARGGPAGRAADYDVPARFLPRFHAVAAEVGLSSFGADSNDPGHVFLPPELPAVEIAMLRLLPRVREVTLATGRPADEAADAVTRSLHRAALARWLAGPFSPLPELRPAAARAPSPRQRAASATGGSGPPSRGPATSPSTAIAAKSSAR